MSRVNVDSEGTRSAYEAICELLQRCGDPSLCMSGMTLEVAADSGVTAWIRDDQDTRNSFHNSGGRRRQLGSSSTQQQQQHVMTGAVTAAASAVGAVAGSSSGSTTTTSGSVDPKKSKSGGMLSRFYK